MYFIFYALILIPHVAIFSYRGILKQINLANFFIFAHVLLFVITPLLFQQKYIVENNTFMAVSIISLVAIQCGFLFKVTILKGIYFEPRLGLMKYVFYFLMLICLYEIVGGLSNFESDKTLSALENEYKGRGVLDFIKSFGKILILFYFAFLFRHKKKSFYFFYAIYFLSILLTSAHRTPVAITLMLPILLYFIYNQRGKLKILHLFVFAIVIANVMLFMNYFRQGLVNELSYSADTAISASFINTLSGINTTKNLYTLIDEGYEIEYLDKVHYFFVGFIPRKLYPEKPVVSFNVRTTEKVFGYKIGEFKGADVITYTVPGEGYIQLSFLGVFIFTFFSVLLSRILVSFYLKFMYVDFLLVTFLFSIFINFRSAFDSFYYSVVYSVVFLIVLIPFFRIKRGDLQQNIEIINSYYKFV